MKLLSPFYSKQLECEAKLMDLLGWQLPEVYTSVDEEYWMVRERAGFTDYSFQGAIAVAGNDAFCFLQKILVNDLRKISPGKAIYSSILDETAKVIDDAITFWVEEDFLIVNCAFTTKQTIEWLKKNAKGLSMFITEIGTCALALQGPKSRDVLQKAVNIKDLPYFSLKRDNLGDIPALIARVSFSGELGYELYVYPEYAQALWDTLIELGKEYNVRPYGLGVVDIHSIEKGYLDLGDFYEGATPLEVGLGWTVGFDKDDFIGREALLKRRSEGLKTKLMGFEVTDPEIIASPNDKLIKEGVVVGQITYNGIYGPAIGKSIGRGWVDIKYANEGEELELEHEGKKTKIKLAKYRWYDPENRKVRG
jgi:aminomethyltransferase